MDNRISANAFSSVGRRIRRALKLHGWRVLLGYVVAEARRVAWNELVLRSYSQHGEDRAIDSLLARKRRGFYVDVGAGDPTRMNNTKRFYLRGWSGVNIEPNLASYRRLSDARPRDVNLNAGIASEEGRLTFFQFEPANLSTFSREEASHRVALGFAEPATHTVPTLRLSTVFQRYAPGEVDLLCVDTEGYEMQVLQSNDWEQHRPRVICVETASFELDAARRASRSEIATFLSALGYRCVLDNGLNSIFVRGYASQV